MQGVDNLIIEKREWIIFWDYIFIVLLILL